jgi:hypothetical protein
MRNRFENRWPTCVKRRVLRVSIVLLTVLTGPLCLLRAQEHQEDEGKQQVIRSGQTVALRAKLLKSEENKGLPPELWLGISENKEWQCPIHQHAWGTAMVSTRKDFGDRYPVKHLRLRIDGPQGIIGDLSCDDCSEKSVDNQYFSTNVCGNFTAHWLAVASDPHYGTWQTANDF